MSEKDERADYGHPPKDKQFRKGQSGNPRGRPRGPQDPKQILRKVLDRRIKLTIGDKLEEMTVREGLVWRVRELAKSGDAKAMEWVMAILQQCFDAQPKPVSAKIEGDPRAELAARLRELARRQIISERELDKDRNER